MNDHQNHFAGCKEATEEAEERCRRGRKEIEREDGRREKPREGSRGGSEEGGPGPRGPSGIGSFLQEVASKATTATPKKMYVTAVRIHAHSARYSSSLVLTRDGVCPSWKREYWSGSAAPLMFVARPLGLIPASTKVFGREMLMALLIYSTRSLCDAVVKSAG